MMQTFHSLQFDNKRREVESWLARMDVWLGQMRPVGSTAEMLDVQVREQKVNLNIYFYLCISDFMFISDYLKYFISIFLQSHSMPRCINTKHTLKTSTT